VIGRSPRGRDALRRLEREAKPAGARLVQQIRKTWRRLRSPNSRARAPRGRVSGVAVRDPAPAPARRRGFSFRLKITLLAEVGSEVDADLWHERYAIDLFEVRA
jgi:hypothetical protein